MILLHKIKDFYGSRLTYAPIFNINKYKNLLLEKELYNPENIENHLRAIREQRVTQIFYLPKYGQIEDSLVFLDRVNNCPTDFLKQEEIEKRRLFSLSMYGFYLFLFKLSLHFTRVREYTDRK